MEDLESAPEGIRRSDGGLGECSQKRCGECAQKWCGECALEQGEEYCLGSGRMYLRLEEEKGNMGLLHDQ